MLPSFFICISLIWSTCHGYVLHGPLMSPTTVSSNSILSPDYYDKIFAVADFQVERNHYQVSLRLEDWQDQIFDECTFNVTTTWPIVKVGATSLTFLMGSRKVVLAWYDEIEESGLNFRRRPQIIAMNFEGCRSSDLGLGNLSRDPIVIPVTTGGFELYLADPANCKGNRERCEIYYNANFLTFYDPVPFNVNLDWSSLQIQHHFADVLVRGFDDSNAYRVSLIDYQKYEKPIMSWNNADSQIAVITSTWAFCYVENPSVDTVVNCSQFDHKGKVIYSKTTEFDVPVTPLAVKFLRNGQFYLLTGRTSCGSDESCWELTWTIVSNDNVTSGVEEFDCTGDRKSLVVSRNFWREDGSMNYWYMCKKNNRYVYNENHFEL